MNPAPTNEDRPITDAELLASHLASRDAACPGCGYNLRGCAAPACPECGRALELTLQAKDAGIPHRMFLLLALGWVLLAGSMNSYRFIGALVEEYRWSTQPFGNLGSRLAPSNGGGGTLPIWTTAGPPTRVSIFDLSAGLWARAIWAGGLVIGALGGLLALEHEWRGGGARPGAVAGRDRRIARLVVYSWVLFGIYAAWHIVNFGRELLR